MLNLLTAAIGLTIYGVAIAICWQQHAWRNTWDSQAAKWIAVSSAAAMWGASVFEEGFFRAFFAVPAQILLLWPLLGASIWLGRASGYPIEGKSMPIRGWRPVRDGLAIIGGGLMGTFLLEFFLNWPVQGDLPRLMRGRPQDPVAQSVWSALILFGFATLEEFFYRGVLLRWLLWETREWKHRVIFALLLSSALFYLGHGTEFSGPKLIQIVLLGIGFGYLSLRHGLWVAILAHSLFNLTGHWLF